MVMHEIIYRLMRRRILSLCGLLALMLCCGLPTKAETAPSKIMCRAGMSSSRRVELAEQLRGITGWTNLHFDGDCVLRFGDGQFLNGSQTARALFHSAQSGKNLIVLEDASNRADVVFSRVLAGRWQREASNQPPAYIVQIDFADFSRVRGDKDARAAFNAGWGVMHEIDHVVHDSTDAEASGAAGACEDSVNRMRRECGLAERAEYFFTFMPGAAGSTFQTRFVRLAFERVQAPNKRRRYWVFWDAELTGGLPTAHQVATR